MDDVDEESTGSCSDSEEYIDFEEEFLYLTKFSHLSNQQKLKIQNILKNQQKHVVKSCKIALEAFEPCLHMFNGKHHLDELYWRMDNRVRDKFNNYLEVLQKVDIISLVEFEDSICAPFVTDNYLFIPGL